MNVCVFVIRLNSYVELVEYKVKRATNRSIAEWCQVFQLSRKKEKLSRGKIASHKASLGKEGACEEAERNWQWGGVHGSR